MTKAPEDILIRYTSPNGLIVEDITGDVIYADAYFEGQSAAVPGSFHLTVRDVASTHEFVSGGVIELWVGTVKMYGGFITVPTKGFFFPALRTAGRVVTERQWSLDGVDFNLLLDKRILRRPADYTHKIPSIRQDGGNCNDKHIISDRFDDYFDLGFSGGNTLDVATKVRLENWFTNDDNTYKWVWPTQGSTMREVLDALVIETTIHGNDACIYWVDAEKRLNWLALQDTYAGWGFSDYPSSGAVSKTYIRKDGTVLNIPFIGWRDGSVSADGSSVINEVFVWGGSPMGSNGTVVLGHKWNQASIDEHDRWQMAEVRAGEDGFKTQNSVNARANALISGKTSGTSPVTGAQGLVNPDEQYVLTWFAHDVPLVLGVRQHLVPGNVTTLNLWSFSPDGGVTPFAVDVPLRQVRITFPVLPADNAEEDPKSYVEFQGTFGLFMSDAVWWWEFLRKRAPASQQQPVITTSNDSESFPYGSYFTGTPTQTPDGSRKMFTLPCSYISGSVAVTLNGIAQPKGTAWTETSATNGTFTFVSAPVSTDTIGVTCRTG